MNIFETIPGNFFSVLSSKNKALADRIYHPVKTMDSVYRRILREKHGALAHNIVG